MSMDGLGRAIEGLFMLAIGLAVAVVVLLGAIVYLLVTR